MVLDRSVSHLKRKSSEQGNLVLNVDVSNVHRPQHIMMTRNHTISPIIFY